MGVFPGVLTEFPFPVGFFPISTILENLLTLHLAIQLLRVQMSMRTSWPTTPSSFCARAPSTSRRTTRRASTSAVLVKS
ncbi:hypothetical protein E2542_SST30448 [Spatholobus suberectus]|nr:hypothetical protein E2542_SST30448 [Spatholobus suberectus]